MRIIFRLLQLIGFIVLAVGFATANFALAVGSGIFLFLVSIIKWLFFGRNA